MLIVRLFRVVNGLTIHELSKRTGVAASKLSFIERGLETASQEEVRRIADAIPGFSKHSGALMHDVDPEKLAEALL